jgi:DNA (cytosine-5)-methyltransferase 1
VRALREIRPLAFVAENVAGFGGGRQRAHFRSLVDELERLRFTVTSMVLNAADYGVPQKRHRLLIIGLRGRAFEFPRARFGPGCNQGWRPAGNFIGVEALGTPNPSSVTYARTPDLRPNPYGGHIFNGGGRPIDLSRPAPTLLASMGGNKTPWVDTAGMVPSYHAHLLAGGKPRTGRVPGARRITVEEAAILQSFPTGMYFAGTRSSCYRQVGNAVPPLLAHEIGIALRGQLAS